MELRQYLIDTFKFNDEANRKILKRILELPDKELGIKYFSHLINSQLKWMARVKQQPDAAQMSWWDPVYAIDELEAWWDESLKIWISFLEKANEADLDAAIRFTAADGTRWEVKIKDIALQLNYHSIHHRAQIQTLIRQQGFEPDFIDYIGTVYKKLSDA